MPKPPVYTAPISYKLTVVLIIQRQRQSARKKTKKSYQYRKGDEYSSIWNFVRPAAYVSIHKAVFNSPLLHFIHRCRFPSIDFYSTLKQHLRHLNDAKTCENNKCNHQADSENKTRPQYPRRLFRENFRHNEK